MHRIGSNKPHEESILIFDQFRELAVTLQKKKMKAKHKNSLSLLKLFVKIIKTIRFS